MITDLQMKNITRIQMKGGEDKMNKKILLPVLGVMILGTVFALGFYGVFSTTFDVQSSITLAEECTDSLTDVFDGSTAVGTACVITNNAPSERSITVSDDAVEGIDVSYIGTLELDKKDTTTWLPVGTPITVGYTIVGDSFEVTDVPEGYTAIYYKDGVVSLGERLENPQPAISVDGLTILPEEDDFNIDELADYCLSDGYNQCKGAKIWVVPTADLSEGTLNWANMANYYYELDLIQYNSEGNLVLSPESTMTLTPVYTIGAGVTGEQTVTTTIA